MILNPASSELELELFVEGPVDEEVVGLQLVSFPLLLGIFCWLTLAFWLKATLFLFEFGPRDCDLL